MKLSNRITWVPNLEGRKDYALVRANMSNYIIFTSHNKQSKLKYGDIQLQRRQHVLCNIFDRFSNPIHVLVILEWPANNHHLPSFVSCKLPISNDNYLFSNISIDLLYILISI